MDNLEIYNACREVPKEAQKPFSNGKFSGTDINPMWRIKKLTEQFGPAGIGWYVADVTERAEVHGEMTIAIVTLNLYVKVNGEWSKPIYGTGGNVLLRKGNTSDEGYKMAYTDALSVACKALGIGADIWFANDVTKYTAQNTTADENPPTTRNNAPKEGKYTCLNCGDELVYTRTADGREMSPVEIRNLSYKRFGRVLCPNCMKKAEAEKKTESKDA